MTRPDCQSPPRPLVFLHIPKSAGTTLEEILCRQYVGKLWFRFTGHPDNLGHFRGMSRAERASYDVLSGHVHFGIHLYFDEPVTYMTMLRDPVARVVSQYYFIRASPEHYLHHAVAGGDLSLKEFATRGVTYTIDNDHVRWLTSPQHLDVPIGSIGRQMMEEAKFNLEHRIAAFGLAERFDDSLRLFQETLGWRDVSYEVKNATRERPALEQIPDDTLDAIRDVNCFDTELYEFASRLFERRLPQAAAPSQNLESKARPSVLQPTS